VFTDDSSGKIESGIMQGFPTEFMIKFIFHVDWNGICTRFNQCKHNKVTINQDGTIMEAKINITDNREISQY
jgi:hypothetical protein